jgi:hypothetical protein
MRRYVFFAKGSSQALTEAEAALLAAEHGAVMVACMTGQLLLDAEPQQMLEIALAAPSWDFTPLVPSDAVQER